MEYLLTKNVDFSKTVFSMCCVILCESRFIQRICINCFNYGIIFKCKYSVRRDSHSLDAIYFPNFYGAPNVFISVVNIAYLFIWIAGKGILQVHSKTCQASKMEFFFFENSWTQVSIYFCFLAPARAYLCTGCKTLVKILIMIMLRVFLSCKLLFGTRSFVCISFSNNS